MHLHTDPGSVLSAAIRNRARQFFDARGRPVQVVMQPESWTIALTDDQPADAEVAAGVEAVLARFATLARQISELLEAIVDPPDVIANLEGLRCQLNELVARFGYPHDDGSARPWRPATEIIAELDDALFSQQQRAISSWICRFVSWC